MFYLNAYTDRSELYVRSGERCMCTCVSVHLAPNIVDIQMKFILVVIAICHDC